jgi:NADPH2:quinone reductase
MKAAWYVKNGSARGVMQLGELDKPVAAPGQVLVRIHAIGVNPADSKARNSIPLPAGVERIVPHQDGSGVIKEVGEGVPASRIGERVWIYEALVSGGAGCAAEYVAVPSMNAVLLPDGVSFEVGACLGIPALTAHRCVYADGPVKGQTILVTGGAGAVGAHSIQFAKHGGASVVATISNEKQAAIAKASGADLVIDRHQGDQVLQMQKLGNWPNERSIDRVIDVAFGANLTTTVRVLKPNGFIATYSSDAEPEPSLPFWPLLQLAATIHFVYKTIMSARDHQIAIDAVTLGLREGWLRTTIAVRFTLDQIIEAQESSESGKNLGRVVIVLA